MTDAEVLIADPVFLELTTSEPNGTGKIVRVSAQRGGGEGGGTGSEDGKKNCTQRFESLVRTPRLTLAQCRLAGVTNSELDRAPDLDSVLDQLLEFSLDADAWIVPDGPAARTALREAFTDCGLAGSTGPAVIGVDELEAVAQADCGASVSPARVDEKGSEPAFRHGRYLPHWTQEGAAYFVTFRLADSLPSEALHKLASLKNDSLKNLDKAAHAQALIQFHESCEAILDAGRGECLLERANVAQIVQDSLLHFHNERYWLGAWCIMPNHVHVVVRPKANHSLESILQGWKSFTAHKINTDLNRESSLWQDEYYDHLVRSETDFRRVVEYTLKNPTKAGLDDWPWVGDRLDDFQGSYALDNDPRGRDAPATNACATQFRAAVAALLNLPLPLVAEMNWLLAKSEHPLKKLLKRVEGVLVKERFDDVLSAGKLAFEKLFKDFSPIIDRLKPDEEGVEEEAFTRGDAALSPDDVERLLGSGGPLATGLEGYEDRPEQIAMARRVAEAFAGGKHLIVEAGTGVGKSLAYLVPSVLFAKNAKRPVIISTHTKNLQSQLYQKDVPFLKKHLGVDFEAAVLKGRPNYLCLRKFMFTLQEASQELDDGERAQMLPLMSWAVQTESGDINEMNGFSTDQNYALWDRLHTVGDDCLKRQCPFYKRCFVYKARGEARGADVVITNHALVFSDLNVESGSLPAAAEIVFDEAHKLEDVATDYLASEVTPRRIYKILNRLFRTSQGSAAGRGLLPSLLANMEMARSEFPGALADAIRERLLYAMQAIAPAAEGCDYFFQTLRDWTETPAAPDDGEPERPFVPRERGRDGWMPEGASNAPSGGPSRPRRNSWRGDDRKRYSAQRLKPEEADTFNSAKEAAIARLGLLRQALEKLDEDFKEIRKRGVPRARELTTEIGAQNLFLQELIHDIEFIVKGDEPNYVYWGERLGKRASRMVAAPLDVATLLYSQLYEKKRALIFASATLSLRDVDAEAGSGLAPIRSTSTPLGNPQCGTSIVATPHKKSFEYVKARLGLSLCEAGKLDELLLGSPFDYALQSRLYVPSFLPEPGAREKEFTEKFSSMVAELAIASGGRAMVLYTSYAAMEASARLMRPMLAPENIEILQQGQDGSRESLLERLKENGRSVLLGTASFWEGVDVRGEALSLLVIAKLPFAVFTDPIVQGRCEMLEAAGKDAFLHYSIPNAILKLRQGFGRLIRSKADRGVVVLADKRVLTKRYGAAFLRALPAKAITATHAPQLVEGLRNFLENSGD